MIHIRPQVKRRQSQSYIFQTFFLNSNLEILQETLHVTHLLKLLDKTSKYEMDPTRTVGATEQTWDAGRTDGPSETNIPLNNYVVQGIIKADGTRLGTRTVGATEQTCDAGRTDGRTE